jgi:paraquat-inducible protein B
MRDIISAQIPELDPAIVKLKDIIEVHGDKKLSAEQRRQLDHAKGKAGFHSLTTAASCVLDASRKVLEHYDRLDNQDDKQHVQKLLNMRQAWDQDKQAVEDLLRKGKEVTQRRLKRFVPAAMRAANKSSSTVQASDDSQELNSGYFHQHHTADMRLHQAFYQTARGVSRIVRELPKHEIIA